MLRQAQHERMWGGRCTSALPLGALEDRGDALPTADAHRLEPVAPVAAHQFARQIAEHAPAGRADRVTARNAPPVDVQNLVPAVAVRPAPAPEDTQHLRRDGFASFDARDVAPAPDAAREQPL